MNILFLAAEATPFVKVGGLGDFAGSLPNELMRLSSDSTIPEAVDVRLVIPFHTSIDPEAFAITPLSAFVISHDTGPLTAQVFTCDVNGIRVYLIKGAFIDDCREVYSQDSILDAKKYVFFSIAAMQLVKTLDWQPNVLHANDWHTAPAVYAHYLNKLHTKSKNLAQTLLTIHNLPFMGSGASPVLRAFGLPPAEDDRMPEWSRHLPLPLGLLTADRINTVSPQYALDVLTPEFGAGLESLIMHRRNNFSGILNGIDSGVWNPETDDRIAAHFDDQRFDQRLLNKTALLNELDLHKDIRKPLICMISRMDYQKGVDIAYEALKKIATEDWQAIILGAGDPAFEDAAHNLEARFPERVRAITRFDEGLSHRIYAGSDIMLIPSRYEPCGLTQMIAMRYGCVPVARATGGLVDTIRDIDLDRKGTGFLFPVPSASSLAFSLRRALSLYRDKRRWKAIQKRGMKEDFTWKASALNYLKVYRSLMNS